MHISAIPPGAVPSTSVAGCSPDSRGQPGAESRRQHDRQQHGGQHGADEAVRALQEIALKARAQRAAEQALPGVRRELRHRRQVDLRRGQRNRDGERAQHKGVGNPEAMEGEPADAVAVISSTNPAGVEDLRALHVGIGAVHARAACRPPE